jgi:predicted hydrocarbon binding protein
MLEGTKVEFVKKRCPRHIITPINTVVINQSLEYSAYVGGILTSQKIVDNINDEKGAKKFLAKTLRLFFSKMEKESMFGAPDLYDVIVQKLQELQQIEDNKVASIDAPADVFGALMAEVLSFGLEKDKKLVAKNVGKRIGRWIYIVDAFDDYKKDRESGSYNPFVLLYDGEDFTEDNLISISKMLEAELSLAFSAIELIEDEDKNREEIVKNILCLGMPASVERVCKKLTNNETEKD